MRRTRRKHQIKAWPFLVGLCLILAILFWGVKVHIDAAEALTAKQTEAEQLQHQFELAEAEKQRRAGEAAVIKQYADAPLSEKVTSYIRFIFGPAAEQAIKVADCESGLLDRGAEHSTTVVSDPNKDGSRDFLTFQVNSIHRRRFGTSYMSDWRENVKVAHQLYLEQGWRPWRSSAHCHGLS